MKNQNRMERLLEVVKLLYPNGGFFSLFDLKRDYQHDRFSSIFFDGEDAFSDSVYRLGELWKLGLLSRQRAYRDRCSKFPARSQFIYSILTSDDSANKRDEDLLRIAIKESVDIGSEDDVPVDGEKYTWRYIGRDDNTISIEILPVDIDAPVERIEADRLIDLVEKGFASTFGSYLSLHIKSSLHPVILDRPSSHEILDRPSSHEILASDNRKMIHTLIKAFLVSESEREMVVNRVHAYDGYSIQDKIMSLVNIECLCHGTPVPAIWDRLCDEIKTSHSIDLYSIAQRYHSISPGGSGMGYLDVAEKIGYLPVLLAIAEKLLPMKKEENPLIEELKKCLDCPVPF